MPVGPTAGPIGGPPLAAPPVIKARTTTRFFSFSLLTFFTFLFKLKIQK